MLNEKPKILRKSFRGLSQRCDAYTVSRDVRRDRRQHRSEADERKSRETLLHPHDLSDPQGLGD